MGNEIIHNGKRYSATYPTDLRNNVVTFDSEDTTEPTAWTDMPLLESNSRVKTLMGKISIAFKNLRYLAKMIGSADISAIGDGTITGALTQLNGKNTFSFEEVCIGTWMNGKSLYRKMVDFGELPSNSRKDVPINIENANHVHINIGESFWVTKSNNESNGTSDTFVYMDYIKSIGMGTGIIVIITNNENASKYKAYICLEYTRTTDQSFQQ